uniref:Nonstructural protein n=1 Tax=Parvoviridae sp. TaxID=1940570 RepID=A0A7D3V4G9_9VIRU|nr:MAG: nonstructural protein [Parvoviridae sp.]
MATPTTGGFSGVFTFPQEFLVGKNLFKAREAVCAGYAAPDTGEFVASKFPLNHEFREQIREFLGDPNWDDPDLPWIQLTWDLAKRMCALEEQLNPNCRIFLQLERSETNLWHVHFLFIDSHTRRNITWAAKRMRREMCNWAAEVLHTFCPDYNKNQIWGSLQNLAVAAFSINRAYSAKLGKSIPQPVNPYAMLEKYFWQPNKECFLRGGTKLVHESCDLTKKSAPFTLTPLEDVPDLPSLSPKPGDTLPISYVSTLSKCQESYTPHVLKEGVFEILCMEALRLCKEHMLFTQKDFKLKFPEKFMSFSCRRGGIEKLESTMELFKETIIHTHSAWDIAKARHGEPEFDNISNNKVCKLCTYQGYRPCDVGILLLMWLKGDTGKKNTIYFYGPANTGKTMMAESICKMVGLYGNVNHNNQNFPFNDCHNKAVLWWEECHMDEVFVEAAKCILGGSGVRVDRKGHDSVLVQKTPVVITSNNDITVVTNRNSTNTSHAAALRSRCFRFVFNNWLSSNWGLITVEDMYEFLSWIEAIFNPSVEKYFANHKYLCGTFPYNVIKDKPCERICSLQINSEENLELCPTCSCWTRKSGYTTPFDGTENSVLGPEAPPGTWAWLSWREIINMPS